MNATNNSKNIMGKGIKEPNNAVMSYERIGGKVSPNVNFWIKTCAVWGFKTVIAKAPKTIIKISPAKMLAKSRTDKVKGLMKSSIILNGVINQTGLK